MRDLESLSKHLLQSEFETARSLFDLARAQGFAPIKAAAMVYRQGYLDGKETQKSKTVEAYKKLQAYRQHETPDNTIDDSQPEATIEGSIDND